MATQQPPTRPWFRLPSIARPAPAATPTTEPPAPAPQPRPPVPLPAFRPLGQLQPQEPAAPTTGVSSVPTSPIRRASVPSSPVTKTSEITTSSAPSPPKPKVSAPDSASLPTSPSQKPPPPSTVQRSPPASKPSSISSLPTSPVKPVSTSPVKPVSTSPVKPVSTSPVKPVSTSPVQPVSTFPVKPVSTSPVKTVPTSQTPKPPTVTRTSLNGTTTTTRVPSPTPSTRTIMPAVQTPPQSPKQKPTAPPPSPLVLPPPQLQPKVELVPKIPAEAEQKAVLVQKTIEPKPRLNGTESQKDIHDSHRPTIAHNHLGKHEEHKDAEAKKKVQKKFSSDSEVGMRVITIAGENKGAFMEIIRSPSKQSFDGQCHSLHKKGINPKTDRGGTGWHSSSSSSSGEEGNSKKKDKSHKSKAKHSPPMDAFMNSNVQGVNNSLLFNSSCSHHDPGVHLSLSRKPFAKGFDIKDNSNGFRN